MIKIDDILWLYILKKLRWTSDLWPLPGRGWLENALRKFPNFSVHRPYGYSWIGVTVCNMTWIMDNLKPDTQMCNLWLGTFYQQWTWWSKFGCSFAPLNSSPWNQVSDFDLSVTSHTGWRSVHFIDWFVMILHKRNHLIIITCISYEIVFTISLPKLINIAPL